MILRLDPPSHEFIRGAELGHLRPPTLRIRVTELRLPIAKAKDSAFSMLVSRGPPVTWSWGHSGSGSAQLAVGAITWFFIISAVAMQFSKLEAPRR